MSTVEAVKSLDGESPSLGSLLFPSIKVCAFGPEVLPLGSGTFGIRSLFFHEDRWSSPIAQPEVWFSTDMTMRERGVDLDLTFFGLTIDHPLFFSFYVQAKRVRVGSLEIEAGGLRRYSGGVCPVDFEGVQLIGKGPSRMEVIPIAGDAFWNCQYLIAFEVRGRSTITFRTSQEKKSFIY